jgi:hypothetical protein
VQLRLRVAHASVLHLGNLPMRKAFHVVQDVDAAIAGCEGIDGTLESESIHHASLSQIWRAELATCAHRYIPFVLHFVLCDSCYRKV